MNLLEIADLLEVEPDLHSLMDRLGMSRTSKNRFMKAFDIVRKSQAEIRKNGEVSPQMKPDLLFAHQDLTELAKILPHLAGEDDALLRRKMNALFKGQLDRRQEKHGSSGNTARNVQQELVMLADLKIAGLPAHISDPNPDIFVDLRSRKYSFEVKRVFGSNIERMKRNVKDAAQQLVQRSFAKPNDRGVVVLGVERVFTRGNLLLQSKDPMSVTQFLKGEVRDLQANLETYWSTLEEFKDPRLCGVIIYLTIESILRDPPVPAYVTHVLLRPTAVTTVKRYRKEFVKDIAERLEKLRTVEPVDTSLDSAA